MKYEHTDELGWEAHDEVDEELVQQFETALATPLRRSNRNKKDVPASTDRKRKSADQGYFFSIFTLPLPSSPIENFKQESMQKQLP